MKKALLIGCTYPGSDSPLHGPALDVRVMRQLLTSKLGYPPAHVRVLCDDGTAAVKPTRVAILESVDWLVSGASQGSRLFLHFSGHGWKLVDPTSQETDRYDETIMPSDYAAYDEQGTEGDIRDTLLAEKLLRQLPQGVVLHTLFDSCYSGTMLDLPFEVRYDRRRRAPFWKRTGSLRSTRGPTQPVTAGGMVFQIGASEEDQTAISTNRLPGTTTYTGAATYAFAMAIKQYGAQQTYATLLKHMTETLALLGAASEQGLPDGVEKSADLLQEAVTLRLDADSLQQGALGLLPVEGERVAAAEAAAQAAAAAAAMQRQSALAERTAATQVEGNITAALPETGGNPAAAAAAAAAATAAAVPATQDESKSLLQSMACAGGQLLTGIEVALAAGRLKKVEQVPVLCTGQQFDLEVTQLVL